MAATHVIVARHGEAEYGPAELSYALSDHGGWLTSKGREQAAALAERLADTGVERVLTSPMSRAIETGAIVAGRLGLEPAVVEGTQEFNVGELVGKPFTEADAYFARWIADDLDHRIPGGESGADIISRMHTTMGSIIERHHGETVLLVSHGGAMSLSLSRLVADPGFPRQSPPQLANCATIHLVHEHNTWALTRPWPLPA